MVGVAKKSACVREYICGSWTRLAFGNAAALSLAAVSM
jgi:hypothetical protein